MADAVGRRVEGVATSPSSMLTRAEYITGWRSDMVAVMDGRVVGINLRGRGRESEKLW